MPRMKLTEKAIGKPLAPAAGGKPTYYWDETLRGFGVLVPGKTGTKSRLSPNAIYPAARPAA